MGVAATALLAARQVVLPDPVCTLLYILAIIATIIAFVALLVSLFGGVGGTRTGWRASPFLANWLYPAAVALVAWLLYAFLC